jgi:hypothetical protein
VQHSSFVGSHENKPFRFHGIHAWMQHATNGFTCVLTTSATRQQWPQQRLSWRNALSKRFLPIGIYICAHWIDDKRIFRSNKLANILGAKARICWSRARPHNSP